MRMKTSIAIKFRTHNYVRRQANWFKAGDPAIRWIDPDTIESAEIRFPAGRY